MILSTVIIVPVMGLEFWLHKSRNDAEQRWSSNEEGLYPVADVIDTVYEFGGGIGYDSIQQARNSHADDEAQYLHLNKVMGLIESDEFRSIDKSLTEERTIFSKLYYRYMVLRGFYSQPPPK